MRAALFAAGVGWGLALRLLVAWAHEARRARDFVELLDESELERLQLRAFHDRVVAQSSPGRAADRAPGRESTTPLRVVKTCDPASGRFVDFDERDQGGYRGVRYEPGDVS